MVNVLFSGSIVVTIVQSGLKPYNFTILAAGVETEQLCCNLFAQRGAIMCDFDRTEDRTNLNLKS